MAFRSPDFSKAKHRKETGGWDTPSQKQKVEKWFSERGIPQPETPAERWDVITRHLLEELK